MLPQLTDTRQRLTQSIDKLPQPLVVGMVGVAGYFLLLAFYVANALAFGVVEILWNLEEPAYLYGQEWAMFACVSGLLGAATGVSIALLRHRQWLISALAGCRLPDAREYGV